MTERTVTPLRRTMQRWLPHVAATVALATLCNLGLELSRLAGVEGYPWRYKTPAFAVLFLLGSAILWFVIVLVYAVVGRLWVTVVLTTAATVFVAITDHEKVRVRREPLYPSDWEFTGDIGFLTDMIGVRGILYPALAALVGGTFAVAAVRAARRRRAGPQPQGRHGRELRAHILRRVSAGAVCLLVLGHLAGFNSPGNKARAAYDALGATWSPWSQQRNYLGNGFVGGFLYNLDVPPISPPRGYSAEEMARIAARYTSAAERINATRTPGGLDDVNVVMVLDESFSDPTALRGVRVAEDPIPFTRRLMRSTMSGRMLAQNIGGGTANMEFEALTGMSMSHFPPQLRVPYQMLIPEYASFPSAVHYFERAGHRSLAIHPFTTEMYRRREVYRILGFDKAVFDRRMHYQQRLGNDGYISDAAAFKELVAHLETEQKPLFVNLVTMQNHMPYPDRYAHPVPVRGSDGGLMTDMGHYVRGLTLTDRAVGDLIRRLRAVEEKTVLVFYGDHLPGTYPKPVIEANSHRAMHETPFFVWANFAGAPDAQQVAQPATRPVIPPVTSPTHFLDLVHERAGAAVPPYFALLQEVRRELPAMDAGMLVDSAGRQVRRGELTGHAARLLRDYRLVQYDLSLGERYSLDAMFSAPAMTDPTAPSVSARGDGDWSRQAPEGVQQVPRDP